MGDNDAPTPHLEPGWPRRAFCFCHAFANTPVCCPARAILLTGKYAHKNGMVANDLRLRESETTIAELLVSTRATVPDSSAKWHLDGGPRLPGFIPPGPRRGRSFEFWAANECDHRHFQPTYFRDSDQPISEERFEPEVWTDRAIEFLKETKDRPFFLIVSMGPPHDPMPPPRINT